MKKLVVIMTVLALTLIGASAVLAANQPQALQGVNLATAQPVTDAQAQQIRGADTTLNPGIFNSGKQLLGNLGNGPGFINKGVLNAELIHAQLFLGIVPPTPVTP